MWRGYVRGAIYELTRGRSWDRNTGSIIGAQMIAQEVYDSMATCEDLTKTNAMIYAVLSGRNIDFTDPNWLPDSVDHTADGINVILQKLVDADDGSLFDLDDYIADLILNPLDTTKDLLEMATFIKELSPNVLNIDIMRLIENFKLARYRTAVHEQMIDQSLSLRGIATALGGQDIAGVYDIAEDIIDTASLPAGFLGKLKWLWSKLSYEDVPGWVTWYNLLTSLVWGSIRDATYDVADEVSNVDATVGNFVIDTSTIATAVNGLEITPITNITCTTCGSSGGCGCGTGGIPSGDGDGPFQPPDAPGQPTTPGPGEEPGPGGHGVPPGHPGPASEYSSYKCSAANFVFDGIYNGLIYLGSLSTVAAAWGAGAYVGSVLLGNLMAAGGAYIGLSGAVILFSFVSAAEIVLFILVVAVIAAAAGGAVLAIFSDLAAELNSVRASLVCDLYEAQDVSEAKSAISAELTTAITNFAINPPYDPFDALIRSQLQSTIDFFIPTALVNKLFENDFYAGSYPQGTPCCTCDELIVQTGVDLGSDQYQATFEPESGSYYIRLLFNCQETSPGSGQFSSCGPNVSVDGISGAWTPHPNFGYRFDIDLVNGPGCAGWDRYCSGTAPTFPVDNVKALTLNSDSPFTLFIAYTAP